MPTRLSKSLIRPSITKFLIFAVITTVLFYIFHLALKTSREMAMKSCVYSLETPLRNALSKYADGRRETYLDSEATKQLINQVVGAHLTDCGSNSDIFNGNDIWGNPIRIYVFSPYEGKKTRVRVMSPGPDGKEGTEDDIFVESPR